MNKYKIQILIILSLFSLTSYILGYCLDISFLRSEVAAFTHFVILYICVNYLENERKKSLNNFKDRRDQDVYR